MAIKRKLIEVALPLEDINRESAREKIPRIGYPSTLHLWWARRPLAACRAVLFASIVDDPSSHPDKFPSEEDQAEERERLFDIIRELVKLENINNKQVLKQARDEILKATDGNPPPVLDPFCGGGSIPLEAQRLGLEAHASDLNPVAVLITKALIEIPPKFAGQPPVHPEEKGQTRGVQSWEGAQGLAEDVRYYGQWIRDEAEKRIGHLYPQVKITPELAKDRPDLKPLIGQELTLIAWLWARTVKCKSPTCHAIIPLVGSYWLSRKERKRWWLEPLVDLDKEQVTYQLGSGDGEPPPVTKVGGRRVAFRCPVCEEVTDSEYLSEEGLHGRIGSQLIAMVADGGAKGRIYLPYSEDHEEIATDVIPAWTPEIDLPPYSQALPTARYGAVTYGDLFSKRQLVALNTFGELVSEVHSKVLQDCHSSSLQDNGIRLEEGGSQATGYADAITMFLGLLVGKLANRCSSFCFWDSGSEKVQQPFAQQGINKTWDYCEANPLSAKTGGWLTQVKYFTAVIENLPINVRNGYVYQLDATTSLPQVPSNFLVCCDPPYYTNIGYSDLSDFFYIWHRRALQKLFPSWFSTVLTPKDEELVASKYRFGDQQIADQFFVEGLSKAFKLIHQKHDPLFPITIWYSKKQVESTTGKGSRSTGWEVMLEGLLDAEFVITGTWPIKAEHTAALKKSKGSLEKAIVLVCRPRSSDAGMTTRRDFQRALKDELPEALNTLKRGNIAPVDLAQTVIGPGMAVFSRYNKVVEADGNRMSVRTALQLINQVLDELLAEHESEYDNDTRWALAWYEQYGLNEGQYGDAEVLSKAKDTSVDGLVHAGILFKGGSKVRLLKRHEMDSEWDPVSDRRMPVWELTQQLIRRLDERGEQGAAEIVRKVGALAEIARDLAYRLYTMCERKGWAQEALAYNSLVVAWPEIQKRVRSGAGTSTQTELGL